VKRAIGFSAVRGDSIRVVNMPFTEAQDTHAPSSPPWWQNPQLIALAITILQYLAIALVAWLLWRKMIRPLARQVPQLAGLQLAEAGGGSRALAGEQTTAIEDDEDEDDLDDAEQNRRRKRRKKHAELLKMTQEYAENDPRMVAMIMKNWMNDTGEH